MDPCIVVWLSRNTNKMQLCIRIYYSKVYWRINMFRAAHRSSSGALNCICSLWFIYPSGNRSSGKWISHSTLATAGHHMGIQTRGCKYSLELLMISGVPLETCWGFNKLWNNKLYYKMHLVVISSEPINPSNPELNPICYLLALLSHHFLHVSRIMVKSLTLRLPMSYIYIYGAPSLDVSRSHTTTQHSR